MAALITIDAAFFMAAGRKTAMDYKSRPHKLIPTSLFAAKFGVKSTSVQRSHCVNGHYLGIVPVKLPNGRLMWSYEHALKLLDLPQGNRCA